MSNKQSQESPYTEGLKVKISEQYKPPPKISLVTNYTQRLHLNKQILDLLPNYDFRLENNIKQRLSEWRNTRLMLREQRKNRLEKAREEQTIKERERVEAEKALAEKEDLESSCVNEIPVSTEYTLKSNYSSNNQDPLYSSSYQMYPYSSSSNVLMPTQISTSSYSNILTPIPLSNQSFNKPVDKSPFNISDFEADTSSPFDNVELKTINDMEELAQVLKTDDKYNCATTTGFYPGYQVPQPVSYEQSGFTNRQVDQQYVYNIPNNTSFSQTHGATGLGAVNGYYYPPEPVQQIPNFNSSLSYSTIDSTETISKENTFSENRKSCFRSVPDIVKALETELENTHLDSAFSNHSHNQNSSSNVISRPKSIGADCPKAKIKLDNLEDPFFSLPKNQQEMCRSISSMGFPLPRVARACKQFGNDHKKIVEHLLAMTQLLDLGFSEKDVATALLASNSDRDKALDKLIS